MAAPSSVEWAFPGPAPYTYMHVNPRDLGIESTDPYELGVQYVVHLNLWMQGIEAGKKIDVSRDAASKDAEPSPTLAERNIAAQPMDPQSAEELAKEILGATVVSSDAPWNNEDLLPAAPKPWENSKKTKTSIIDI